MTVTGRVPRRVSSFLLIGIFTWLFTSSVTYTKIFIYAVVGLPVFRMSFVSHSVTSRKSVDSPLRAGETVTEGVQKWTHGFRSDQSWPLQYSRWTYTERLIVFVWRKSFLFGYVWPFSKIWLLLDFTFPEPTELCPNYVCLYFFTGRMEER